MVSAAKRASQSIDAIDYQTIDLAHQCLQVSDDVLIWPVWESGTRYYRVERKSTQQFFRVGQREYLFLSILDGKTTVAAACGIAASHLATKSFSAEETESIVVWLLEQGLVRINTRAADGHAATIPQDGQTPSETAEHSGWLQRFNPFWMAFPLVEGQRRLGPLLKTLAKLFHGWFVAAAILLMGIAVLIYADHYQAVHQSAAHLFSRQGAWYLLWTWVGLKILHEFGHAAVCYRMGCRVGKMGVVFILFAPLAFVDVSSCWRLPRRGPRMLISAAGMFVELSIASVAMLVWWWMPSPTIRFWCANIVLTAGVSTLLFNANPLMRFDGYYLLSDLVQIPNLYGEAATELKRVGKQFLMLDLGLKSPHARGSRRGFLLAYGLVALGWRVMICFVLLVSASTLFHGAGIVLSVIGLLAWLSVPLKRSLSFALETYQWDRFRFFRALGVVVLLAAIMTGAATYPFRRSITIPGVVIDAPESIARAGVSGWITEVHVRDGERVRAGQPLLTIRNLELDQRVRQLQWSLEENQLLSKIAQGELASASIQTIRKDRVAIDEQLSQLIPKQARLSVRAPRDAIVVRRDLRQNLGTFVREGDELMRFEEQSGVTREVVALVTQNQVNAVKSSAHSIVNVVDASNQTALGIVRAIDPRASRQLAHESLSSLHGGPLDVTLVNREPDSKTESPSEHQLVSPAFTLHVDLVSDSPLKSGSRVEIAFDDPPASAMHRLSSFLRDYLINVGEST